MKPEKFELEKTYNAPIQKVWEAITDNEKMSQWYFKLEDFKPEVGFEFKFTGKGTTGVVYHHVCRVTEVIPGKKLVHTWDLADYSVESLVTWELFDEGGKTRLKLTHTGLETMPEDNADFQSLAYGWKHLTNALEEFLGKEQ